MRTPRRSTTTIATAVAVFLTGLEVNAFLHHGRRATIASHKPLFLSSDGSVGPKAESRRRRTPRSSSSSSGPKPAGPRSPRSTRQRRTTEPNPVRGKEEAATKQEIPFDGRALTASQTPNLQAPALDLRAVMMNGSDTTSPTLRCASPGISCDTTTTPSMRPESSASFEYMSLDELLKDVLPAGFSLSKIFNANESFRTNLRSAIRLDVFETTPYYANLPEKAKTVLLLPDSSLEGSWRLLEDTENRLRMKHTTRVLHQVLDDNFDGTPPSYVSGDDLFRAIGRVCGSGASTHWIDIFGVQDRSINHSWHLDAGTSPENCKTVLWGFPPGDDYEGTGVFSHVVSLREAFDDMVGDSLQEHNRMEPILFEGTVDEEYIVRPIYKAHHELLLYRDIDVLHSAPDVAYRSSVMRFM